MDPDNPGGVAPSLSALFVIRGSEHVRPGSKRLQADARGEDPEARGSKGVSHVSSIITVTGRSLPPRIIDAILINRD